MDQHANEEHLFNYLASQVLENQGAEIRFFLLRTSLLPYLSADLCNAYLEITDSAEIIQKLEQNHLFINAYSEGNSQYLRYHSLFADFLHHYLEQEEGQTGVKNWQRRVAACLLQIQANLTPEQRQHEEARVERFINHPEELRKKREQERASAEHTMRIMRALPDAFLFEYAGEEPGSAGIGGAGATLVKLNFRPNPRFQPPSHVEEVLTGMQGYVLLDAARFRIASIDGTLFKEVGFGWGILGHLDHGGRFLVQQQEVGDNLWVISGMTLRFTGKILLFKSLSISSVEIFSGFKRVPANLTFAQALELLKKEELSGAGSLM